VIRKLNTVVLTVTMLLHKCINVIQLAESSVELEISYLNFDRPSGIIVGRDPIHRSKTAQLF